MKMGRSQTTSKGLPPRMLRRVLKSGKTYYYYLTENGRKEPLGSDLVAARLKWAHLENGPASGPIRAALDRFKTEYIVTLSPKTATEYGRAIDNLKLAFGDMRFEQVDAAHIYEYLDKRTAKVAAQREIATMSSFWTWAKQRGVTNAAYPFAGMRKGKKSKRDRYVTEEEFNEVRARAAPILQDAMDLLLLTGQRPSDVLKATRQDIRDGVLWFVQGKTGKTVRVRVEGELAAAIDRMQKRPRKIQSIYLVADGRGQRVTIFALDKAFAKARGDATWQLRDLRAKMITDTTDLREAQKRAGHASEKTTADIYRRVKGEIVGPLR